MFKFSLRLCIWLALLVGSVLGLVLDREPWVMDRIYLADDLAKNQPALWMKLVGRMKKYTSPDETRFLIQQRKPYSNDFLIIDRKTDEPIYELPGMTDLKPISFLENDVIVVICIRDVDDGIKFQSYRRRFPEWWWGIFYRPLFWIAVVAFCGTVFEFVSMRKRLRAG